MIRWNAVNSERGEELGSIAIQARFFAASGRMTVLRLLPTAEVLHKMHIGLGRAGRLTVALQSGAPRGACNKTAQGCRAVGLLWVFERG